MPKKGDFKSHVLTEEGWCKRCAECGELKLLENFWPRYNKPGYQHWCKLCVRKRRSTKPLRGHGYVELWRVQWALEELVARIGRAETARRLGVSKSHITKWLKVPYMYGKEVNESPARRGRKKGQYVTRVQRHTAARWMVLLREVRAAGEAYHPKDIRAGTKLKGKKLREVRWDKRQEGWKLVS